MPTVRLSTWTSGDTTPAGGISPHRRRHSGTAVPLRDSVVFTAPGPTRLVECRQGYAPLSRVGIRRRTMSERSEGSSEARRSSAVTALYKP
jgi:hypothetical protein